MFLSSVFASVEVIAVSCPVPIAITLVNDVFSPSFNISLDVLWPCCGRLSRKRVLLGIELDERNNVEEAKAARLTPYASARDVGV